MKIIKGLWFLMGFIRSKRPYKKYIKRPMDFVLSLLAIAFFSPVFVILAVLVRLKLGTPVIFRQKRPGLHEKIFTLYKFRTMTDGKDQNGELLPDKIRLTRFGKFLRSSSLDELPELFNILKGDMSLVGPRPLLIQYLPLYDGHQKRRHEVRPGLSGLAQVNGRNLLSWEDKFNLDVEYVDGVSFLGDWKIIFKSIYKALKHEGISSATSSTMEPFMGIVESVGDTGMRAMQDRFLLIIGAGGHGRVVADIARRMARWKQIAFMDDDDSIKSSMGIDVIGTTNDLNRYVPEHDIFVAIGNNETRERILTQLQMLGASIPTLVHPSAVIGEQVEIGEGTVVMAGAIINCCTKIGAGCIINTGSSVDHNNVIEAFAHLSPGVSTAGDVKIGKRSWLGIGSVVSNNISIANDCIIGAGSVVIGNIHESGTFVGVPVRKIEKRQAI